MEISTQGLTQPAPCEAVSPEKLGAAAATESSKLVFKEILAETVPGQFISEKSSHGSEAEDAEISQPTRPAAWQGIASWWRDQKPVTPRFSSLDLLATIVLWIGATCGWEWYRACPGVRLPFGMTAEEEVSTPGSRLSLPTPDLSQRATAAGAGKAGATDGLTVTAAVPNKDGSFGYRYDRFEVQVPVALRQLVASAEEPALTRARGRKEGLRFELNRVFDYRAQNRDLSEVARDFAVQICKAAGAELLETQEQEFQVSGQRAVRTQVSMRLLAGGRIVTLEGLTIDEGLVAWSLWAGYERGKPPRGRNREPLLRLRHAAAGERAERRAPGSTGAAGGQAGDRGDG